MYLQETSSYDSILKLKTLEECIWDAQITRNRLAKEINDILAQQKDSFMKIRVIGKAREDCNTVQAFLIAEKKRVEILKKKREKLWTSLAARREAMEHGREYQRSGEKHLEEARPKLAECQTTLASTLQAIAGQQRRIVTDLQAIYPVEPVCSNFD